MKQLSNYIAESLLDTEDEIFDKIDLNIFSIISNSKSEDEFYKHINTLKDLCIAVDIKDDLSKYKNSFFLMELMSTYNRKNHGVKIDKYFKKTKKTLFINRFSTGDLFITKSDKRTFHELKYEYNPALKSDTVYVFPKDIEEKYVEWVAALPAKYLTFVEKSKVL
jgi:hypothetical protein